MCLKKFTSGTKTKKQTTLIQTIKINVKIKINYLNLKKIILSHIKLSKTNELS